MLLWATGRDLRTYLPRQPTSAEAALCTLLNAWERCVCGSRWWRLVDYYALDDVVSFRCDAECGYAFGRISVKVARMPWLELRPDFRCRLRAP